MFSYQGGSQFGANFGGQQIGNQRTDSRTFSPSLYDQSVQNSGNVFNVQVHNHYYSIDTTDPVSGQATPKREQERVVLEQARYQGPIPQELLARLEKIYLVQQQKKTSGNNRKQNAGRNTNTAARHNTTYAWTQAAQPIDFSFQVEDGRCEHDKRGMAYFCGVPR